ncbi:MAG: DUF2130 domain-containing protein [Patescibacteria group bacterium]|nr:DUF2130 domain-containing protein [Patescibacteria group bacterium]
MTNQIKCPHCNKLFEPTDAYKHELEEKLIKETQLKYQGEIKQLKQEKQEIAQSREKEIEEVKKKTTEIVKKQAENKARKKLEIKITSIQEEAQAQEKQNKELQDQLKEMLKQMRQLKNKKDKLAIEYQKKLLKDQDKIKQIAKKEAEDELSLRIDEKDKQLHDAQKQVIILQRKIQQGSQQLQGEILELNFEQLLRDNFKNDIIKPVEKGVKGADVRQTVLSPREINCGVILWEVKRTKAWDNKWLDKLKEDLRAEKANIPVIVTSTLPKEFKTELGLKNGVWVVSFNLAISLAQLLRKNLLDVGYQKAVATHKDEKATDLYEYITSHEFRQQVEAMVEAYFKMKTQISKERVTYEKMWQIREKQVDKLFKSTGNIVGAIQGEVGPTALPIKGLELLESEDNKNN